MSFNILYVALILQFFVSTSLSSPTGLPVSGFIQDPTGTQLTETNVNFFVYILSPDGCVLYSEEHLAKDLSIDPGKFSFKISEGTNAQNAYAASAPSSTAHFAMVLANSSPLVTGLVGKSVTDCSTGQYQPSVNDGRSLSIEFETSDGLGRHVLSHYSLLKSVPYAYQANSATEISGKKATDLVQLNSSIPSYQSRIDTMVSDSSNTTISSVLNGSYVAPLATVFTTAPSGCPVGQYATGIAKNGNLSCATAPTASAMSLASGKILIGDSSNLAAAVSISGDASLSNTGILSLKSIGTPGSYTKVTTETSGLVSAGAILVDTDIPALDWTKITTGKPTTLLGYGITDAIMNSGTTPSIQSGADAAKTAPSMVQIGRLYIAEDTHKIYRDTGSAWVTVSAIGSAGGSVTSVVRGSGLVSGAPITTSGVLDIDLTTLGQANKILALDSGSKGTVAQLGLINGSSNILLKPHSTSSNYSLIFPASQGGNNQFLVNDGSGNLSWSSGAIPGDASYSVKGVVQADTDAVTSGLNLASGILSVNSGTGPNQIVKLNASAKLPAVSAALVTNLNPTQITGTVPVNKGGTGQTSFMDGQLLIGNSVGNTLSKSSLSAGPGIILTHGNGSITIEATSPGGTVGNFTGNLSGDVTGTQTATVVEKIQGYTVSNTNPNSGDMLTWNGSQWIPATAGSSTGFSGTLSGDVSGTQSSTVVDKIKNIDIDLTGLALNKLLKFDGTKWAIGNDDGGTGTVTAITAGAGLTGGSITTSGTLSVDSTIVGAANKILALDPTSKSQSNGMVLKSGVGAVTLSAAASSSTYQITLPASQGGANQLLVNDGSGNLSWASETAVADASYAVKGLIQGDTDSATSGFNLASGVLSLNTGTGAHQILKLDASARLPAVDASNITNINPTNFGSSLPLTKGGTGATALGTSDQILGMTNSGLDTEYKSVVAGSGISVVHSPNTVTISATGLAGTVTNASAVSPLAVVNGTTVPALSISSGTATGQTLRFDGTSTWLKTFLLYTDLNNSSSARPWPVTSCAAGEALVYTSGTDSLTCTQVSLTSGSLGSQSANTFLATPNGSSGTPTFRTIVPSDLGSGTPNATNYLRGDGTWGGLTNGALAPTGTGQVVFNDSGAFGADSSFFWDKTNLRLGLGTSTPGSALDVKGAILLNGTTSGSVGFQAAADAGSTTYTMPAADGTSTQVLKTNGSGALSFGNNAGGVSQWTTSGSNIYFNTFLVGINTSAPLSKLDVNGNMAVGTYAGSTAAPANGLIVSGPVGIGNNVPKSNFDVTGAMAIGTYAGSTAAPGNGLIVSGNVGLGTSTVVNKLDVNGGVALGTYAPLNAAPNNGLIMSGTFGIGTNAPSAKLSVSGNLALGSYAGTVAAPANGMIVSGLVGIGTPTPVEPLTTAATTGTISGFYSASRSSNHLIDTRATPVQWSGPGIGYYAKSNSANSYFLAASLRGAKPDADVADNGGAFVFTVAQAGVLKDVMTFYNRLGDNRRMIGTKNFANALDINGNMAIGTYAGSAAGPTGGLIVSGNVGIGTSAPLSPLSVNGGLALGTYAGVNNAPTGYLIAPGSMGIGTSNPLSKLSIGGGVAFGTYASTDVSPANGAIVSGGIGVGTTAITGGKFDVNQPTVDAVAMQAQQGGNVFWKIVNPANGISNSWNAGAAVHYVAKDSTTSRSINAEGSVNSAGADFAEWIEWNDTEPEMGSVVKYKGIYVVVSSPHTAAFIGNDAIASKKSILIAFAGQLPVLVRGKVQVGDLIVADGQGSAIAVPRELATIEDTYKTVGTAWAASDEVGLKRVHVAVGKGLNGGNGELLAFTSKIKNKENKLLALKIKKMKLDQELAQLIKRLDQVEKKVTTQLSQSN